MSIKTASHDVRTSIAAAVGGLWSTGDRVPLRAAAGGGNIEKGGQGINELTDFKIQLHCHAAENKVHVKRAEI